ncbi:MAG: hypothetical protein RDU25_04925 [Patescibacteria group bacterium]|nr:hypothetical protein [Patescibacteria group bacterium]
MPRKISAKKVVKPSMTTKPTPILMPVLEETLIMPPVATKTVVPTPKKPQYRTGVLWSLFAFFLAAGIFAMACMVYQTKVNLGFVMEENGELREAVRLMQMRANLPSASGTVTTVSGLSDGSLSAALKSAQDLQNQVLQQLSADWKNDAELSNAVGVILDEKYLFPNEFDIGEKNFPPTNGFHYYSLQSNKGDKILRAYLTCTEAIAGTDAPVCGKWEEEFRVYDAKTYALESFLVLQEVHGANSGYLSMPLAWSKNDQLIILKDLMLSPGAGGGSATPAYWTVDISKGSEQKPVFLATDSALFYDAFSKVIYLDQGDKSVRYIQPGPRNNSKIIYKNILGGQTKVLHEDPDTEYKLEVLNEDDGVLTYTATKFTFDDECQRADGNQDCAEKATTRGEITLP